MARAAVACSALFVRAYVHWCSTAKRKAGNSRLGERKKRKEDESAEAALEKEDSTYSATNTNTGHCAFELASVFATLDKAQDPQAWDIVPQVNKMTKKMFEKAQVAIYFGTVDAQVLDQW